MVSGNDAAVALSEFVGGDTYNFVQMMNDKATKLGLSSTHFETPHGLDQDEHYTTAYELAVLADYALQNKAFAKIVMTSNYTVNINGSSKTLHNTNELLGYFEGVYGVKTGFTNGANRCLVTSCKKGNINVICVVLGCDTKKDRTLDSIKLLNYIFNNFSTTNVKDIIENDFNNWIQNQSKSIKINKGIYQNLEFGLAYDQIQFEKIALKNDNSKNVTTSINISSNFVAPLLDNSPIGSLTVYINDVEYYSVDIVNKSSIIRKNIFNYLYDFFTHYFDYALS